MNFEPIFGEENEIIGYLDEFGHEWSIKEVDEYYTVV